MAISDYFNKVAVRTRKTESSQNDYGEPIFTEATITISGALQPQTKIGASQTTGVGFRTDEKGNVIETTHNWYCAINEDIIPGDLMTIDSDDYKVIHVNDDAGRGNHLKCGLKLVE